MKVAKKENVQNEFKHSITLIHRSKYINASTLGKFAKMSEKYFRI